MSVEPPGSVSGRAQTAGSVRPLVVVEGVSKSFRQVGTVALQDCSLDVAPHEICCVIGPSGCGKTTLLRIIDGLLRPDSGRVFIDGVEITGPRPDMAMVFQHFGLFPWMTVYDNVAYGLRVHGRLDHEISDVVRRHIEMVGLHGFEHVYPYQLSGGMQQRVGLARALAVDPKALLMDEPFGSLDAQTRELMQEELLRLWRAQPKTMIFVTHSIDEAIILGDRIALMTIRPGRVKEVLAVNIARPRDPEEVRRSARYHDLRDHIWHELRVEVAGRKA